MNFNKLTKAELISKFKKLENNSKINNQNITNIITNYFSHIWELILTFKNILLKLTLISLIINIVKKYKIIRKLWWIINSIGLSIYGLFLLDNFAFEFVTNFFKEIKVISSNVIDYFSNTQFYTYLNKLFSKNEIIEPSSESTNKSRSMIESNKTETIRSTENVTKSEGNSRISEWLKPQKDAYEEIKTNETNYNKYYIICGMIVLACLTWVYADEVKSGFSSLIDWINSFRAGPPNNGGGDISGNNRIDSLPDQKPTVETVPNTPSSPNVELIDNTSKGKTRLLTSPSMENMTKKVEESWQDSTSISPGSPDSSGSSETIKPSVTTTTASTSESNSETNSFSSYEIDAIELALLDRVRREWKDFCPSNTQIKIKFIEENLKFVDDFFIRKQLTEKLCEIEIDLINISDRTKLFNNNLKRYELIQTNLIQTKLSEWISSHHDKILNRNFSKYK